MIRTRQPKVKTYFVYVYIEGKAAWRVGPFHSHDTADRTARAIAHEHREAAIDYTVNIQEK
jgi:hypothetical protein